MDGDDADVDLDVAAGAQAGELAILQDVQELGLQRQGHLADLVEEDGAAVGELELAELALVGAGEGAALVAEELGLEELEGEGGAVDLDEGALAAGGAVVDGAGDELLADAGLAPDEDGGIGVGDLIDHFLDGLHARAVLEHPVVLGAAPLELAPQHLLPEMLDFPLKCGLFQHILDRAADVVTLQRLGQKIAGSSFHGLDDRPGLTERGDHDHGGTRTRFSHALEERQAVLSAQADVEEHHRRLQFVCPLQPSGGVGTIFHVVPHLPDHGAQGFADVRIVVDHEEEPPKPRGSHARLPRPGAARHGRRVPVLRDERQREGEPASRIHRALCAELSPMGVDDLVRDGQPEADPLALLGQE